MQADFSVELGADDPTLALPWSDPETGVAYVDLKLHPEALSEIQETQQLSELRDFLASVNSRASRLQSAKCDVWSTREMTEEDEIFGAAYKFGGYVDIFFAPHDVRMSFEYHEDFARRLVALLKRAPEFPASVEAIIRRAHFEPANGGDNVQEGFYFTAYIFGFGDDELDARQFWGIALKVVGNALIQVSAAPGVSLEA